MRYAFNGLLVILVMFVACLAGACGSDGGNMGASGSGGTAGSGGSAGSGGQDSPGTTTVGEEGGVADSASGNGSVSIPSGAIASGTIDITVDENSRNDFPDPDNRWSEVFEFGPDGSSFDVPVTISLALDEDRVDSAATLWRLNEATEVWEEIELSYTSAGRVWGQTTGFSIFSAGPASAPNECTNQAQIALQNPGSVDVAIATRDATTLVAPGTPHERETGSVWITQSSSFTVSGMAGPPGGQGGWIDFATGPEFETGTFAISPNGAFSVSFDVPPLGFRYLGLTDACLAPFATATNGWLYNLEVYCDTDCVANMNAPPCDFPQTVNMQQVGMSSTVSASFAFLAGEECTLGQWQGLVFLLTFSRDAFDVRDVIVIAGANQWTILTSSEGRELIAGGRWVDLPDATDITMTVQDAFDSNAPVYELVYRFDGDTFTARSFTQL